MAGRRVSDVRCDIGVVRESERAAGVVASSRTGTQRIFGSLRQMMWTATV